MPTRRRRQRRCGPPSMLKGLHALCSRMNIMWDVSAVGCMRLSCRCYGVPSTARVSPSQVSPTRLSRPASPRSTLWSPPTPPDPEGGDDEQTEGDWPVGHGMADLKLPAECH